jgi:hypothetical protein
METNSYPNFSINRGVDLCDDNNTKFDMIDLSFLPLSALLNCNEIVVSLLKGSDVQKDIDRGVNPNGVTEKSPFFPPLIWVGIVYMSDWEQEKQLIRRMLLSKIDCNYVGLCGFNLFHFYLVQSIVAETGFQKLKWWVDKPMVDCNVFSLSLYSRPNITMLHPAQLISKITKQSPEYKKRADNVVAYLISRGMSCDYLEEGFYIPEKNGHLAERHEKQLFNNETKKEEEEKQVCFLPTPQMNHLEDIPHDQHLSFSSSKGLLFRFHGSYMDPIIKTHRFPFTMEEIDPLTIEKWMGIFEDTWIPREEFVRSCRELSLCQETYMEQEKMFVHLLNNWVAPIYPYSRIIMLSTFQLTERICEYMCMRMRSGMFHLKPFHQKCVSSWKNFFLWACYDCIHEFLFANQVEELVSQLEIFFSWKTPFLEEYPNVETFILMNSFQSTMYKVFSEEFDYTMCQVYFLFKKMFLFMKKS